LFLFHLNARIFEHSISEHLDEIETIFLYRLKSDKNSSTTKKRTHDEYEEDGFQELLYVEEEDDMDGAFLRQITLFFSTFIED